MTAIDDREKCEVKTKELEELNEFVANYNCYYRVISGHGKYALMDDDSGFNIPVIICENPQDIKDYLEELIDDDDLDDED